MSFKILKKKRNLLEIKWSFDINRQRHEETKQIFELEELQILCTPTLKLSFNCHVTKVDYSDEFCEADVYVSLKQILSCAWLIKFPNCHHRPSAVRFKINKSDETHLMKPSSSPANWKSDTFACKFSKQALPSSKIIWSAYCKKPWIFLNPNSVATVELKIWIEFTDSFNNGPSNTLKHLTKLYVDQKYCDVQFHFEDESSIGGHTYILSARSPVFAAMFEHEMEESKTGQVEIKDIESNIFSQLLHYIYSGQTKTKIVADTALSLYTAADKYDIEDLKEECVDYLISNISLSNAINLFVWGYLHSVSEVQDSALKFMEKNSNKICLQDDWAHFLKNYPELGVTATRIMMNYCTVNVDYAVKLEVAKP